jgi:hypothetical protein
VPLGADRTYGQDVVVVPRRAGDDLHRIPVGDAWPRRIRERVLLVALAGRADVPRGRDDDYVLDVHRVGQCRPEGSVVETTVGGKAGDGRDVDHRRPRVGRRAHRHGKGLDITDTRTGGVAQSPKRVARLPDTHDGGIGSEAAERGARSSFSAAPMIPATTVPWPSQSWCRRHPTRSRRRE